MIEFAPGTWDCSGNGRYPTVTVTAYGSDAYPELWELNCFHDGSATFTVHFVQPSLDQSGQLTFVLTDPLEFTFIAVQS
jgi:hypothetical protein